MNIASWHKFLAVMMVIAGAAAFAYGVGWHTVPILVEQKPELDSEAEAPAAVAAEIPEREVVRDTTVDALIRLTSGEIKRPYLETPAQLCPT